MNQKLLLVMVSVGLSLFVVGCGAFVATSTPLPPIPTMTLTPTSGLGASVNNERWEVVIEEIDTETMLTTDLISETRTYTAEEGSVFVVVRARLRLFDQVTWKEIRGKDLLPMAIILTDDGRTFPAVGPSKTRGDGCVGDCQFLLFGEEVLSEPREIEGGFIFALKIDDVFGKVLRFQFEDLPSILLEVTEN